MNGKLKKPTSWSSVRSEGILPTVVLAVRPNSAQSAAPSPLWRVAPHSVLRVFRAYKVDGKKEDVHVLGENSFHFPPVVVYCGYWVDGAGASDLAVVNTLLGISGENSCDAGNSAAMAGKKRIEAMMAAKCILEWYKANSVTELKWWHDSTWCYEHHLLPNS